MCAITIWSLWSNKNDANLEESACRVRVLLFFPMWPNNGTLQMFNVIFTLLTGVPLSTVIPLYWLHLIAAPSTVEKCKH